MSKALTGGFTLSKMVKHVADELRLVSEQKTDKPVMAFNGCEIELAVTVKAEASGGIKFWVIEAGANTSGEVVSKIKLSFRNITSNPLQLQSTTPDTTGPAATR